jgi:hypothetical protein
MDPMNMIQNSAIKLVNCTRLPVFQIRIQLRRPIRLKNPDLDSGRQKNCTRKKEKIIKYFEEPEHPLKLFKKMDTMVLYITIYGCRFRMADFYHSLPSVTTGRKETENRITNKKEPDWGFPGTTCLQR